MAAVPMENFVAIQNTIDARLTELGNRLMAFETRLNELLTTVDTKYVEHSGLINEVNAKIPMIEANGQRIEAELPNQFRHVLDEQKKNLVERMSLIEQQVLAGQTGMMEMNTLLGQVRTEVVRIGNAGGGGGNSHNKSLLDSKQFVLVKFDGDEKLGNKENFDEWRDDIEEYLNAQRPGLKAVLEAAARYGEEISRYNFEDVVRKAGLNPGSISWSYKEVAKDAFTFIKKYLTGRAKKAFMTSSDDVFEGYRRMVLEIDPINSGTKGKMMDVLTGLIAGGQCKSFKETKMKAMDLEIIVKAYRKTTNEEPDQSLLASVLSNIIDQKTKEKFSDLKMLHSYKDMKQNILETATETNLSANRMDIGNVDAE